jgi:hypothetical protein
MKNIFKKNFLKMYQEKAHRYLFVDIKIFKKSLKMG